MDLLILIGFFISVVLVVLLLKKLEKKYGVDRAEAGEPLKKIERSASWISGMGSRGFIEGKNKHYWIASFFVLDLLAA